MDKSLKRLRVLEILNDIPYNMNYYELVTILFNFLIQEISLKDFIYFTNLEESFETRKDFIPLEKSDAFANVDDRFLPQTIYSFGEQSQKKRGYFHKKLDKNEFKQFDYLSNSDYPGSENSYLLSFSIAFQNQIVGILEIFSPQPLNEFDEVFVSHICHFLEKHLRSNLNIIEEQKKELIRQQTEKYFSKDVYKLIAKGENLNKLGKKEIVSCFLDIRDFTRYSLNKTPNEVFSNLNYFFDFITKIIFQYSGSINKFMGDAIFSIWGIFENENDHYLEKAIRAHVDILKEVKKQIGNKKIPDEWRVGIGISIGECIIGNLGGDNYLEYTAIGQSINLASHLCNKAYDEILVDEDTKDLIFNNPNFSSLNYHEKTIIGKKNVNYNVLSITI